MRFKLTQLLVPVILILAIFACQKAPQHKAHTLIITSDFGSVRNCKTLDELHEVARIMISASPDIQMMDIASPDLVNYQGDIGVYVPGRPIDSLFAAGYDPYGIMVDTLRNHGIKVLGNVRMNDHHGVLEYWTPWEQEHVEWSLGKDTGDRDWKSIGALRHMDYAVEGVRKHRFAILEEIVQRYPLDGLQLDFGRTLPFVSEPKQKNGKFMTSYLRQVRQLLDETGKKRNQQMMLGVLLPWDLNVCRQEGLQVKQWIKEKLVDFVSPGEWYYADWNIPLDEWHMLTKNTECKLYPFTPGNVSSYQSFEYGEVSLLGENNLVLDPPKIRAIADNFMSQGVDGFAFYNFYTFNYGQYYPELRTWTDPDKNKMLSKHYFNCRRLMYHANERDAFDLGVAFKRHPLKSVGDKAELPFRFSSDLSQSNAVLRFVFKYLLPGNELEIRLNNTVIEPVQIWWDSPRLRGVPRFPICLWEGKITIPPLKQGINVFQIELTKQIDKQKRDIEVGEFEIMVEPKR